MHLEQVVHSAIDRSVRVREPSAVVDDLEAVAYQALDRFPRSHVTDACVHEDEGLAAAGPPVRKPLVVDVHRHVDDDGTLKRGYKAKYVTRDPFHPGPRASATITALGLEGASLPACGPRSSRYVNA